MDTLNQANPFFIRCIKSNANKVPNEFDDETVQRQLRLDYCFIKIFKKKF